VSWNHFHHHDKTTLVGSSDGQALDEGKLKVTFHHNWYERIKERTPRVRYGETHVYNNLFEGGADGPYSYGYSLGIGHQSRIYSERNAWVTPPSVRSAQLLRVLKGNRFFDNGSTHNGLAVDLLSALRTTHSGVDWVADVGWKPSLFLAVDNVAVVPSRVRAWAGAGRGKAD
jgi:pectate lyase